MCLSSPCISHLEMWNTNNLPTTEPLVKELQNLAFPAFNVPLTFPLHIFLGFPCTSKLEVCNVNMYSHDHGSTSAFSTWKVICLDDHDHCYYRCISLPPRPNSMQTSLLVLDLSNSTKIITNTETAMLSTTSFLHPVNSEHSLHPKMGMLQDWKPTACVCALSVKDTCS